MNKIGYIYITTNLINNKKYIGQHKAKEFDNKYLGSGILLSEAIHKYGKENFKIEILEWCCNSDELNEREIYWISKFNATTCDDFYNLHKGGGSGWDYVNQCWKEGKFIRKPLSDEVKERMRKPHNITPEGLARWGHKGKHLTSEHKKKVSDSLKIARKTYSPIWNKGISPSHESVTKMINTRKDEMIGFIPVRCIENNYIFKNQVDAVNWLGLKTNKISECISGSRDTTGGYHWEKVDPDGIDLNSINYDSYEPNKLRIIYIKNKEYLNVNTGERFKSVTEFIKRGYKRSDFNKINKICCSLSNEKYLGSEWKFIEIK